MSEEGSFWTALAERFFGFLLIVIGAIFAYYTLASESVLGVYTAFFGFLSLIVLVLGIFLLTAKYE